MFGNVWIKTKKIFFQRLKSKFTNFIETKNIFKPIKNKDFGNGIRHVKFSHEFVICDLLSLIQDVESKHDI